MPVCAVNRGWRRRTEGVLIALTTTNRTGSPSSGTGLGRPRSSYYVSDVQEDVVEQALREGWSRVRKYSDGNVEISWRETRRHTTGGTFQGLSMGLPGPFRVHGSAPRTHVERIHERRLVDEFGRRWDPQDGPTYEGSRQQQWDDAAKEVERWKAEWARKRKERKAERARKREERRGAYTVAGTKFGCGLRADKGTSMVHQANLMPGEAASYVARVSSVQAEGVVVTNGRVVFVVRGGQGVNTSTSIYSDEIVQVEKNRLGTVILHRTDGTKAAFGLRHREDVAGLVEAIGQLRLGGGGVRVSEAAIEADLVPGPEFLDTTTLLFKISAVVGILLGLLIAVGLSSVIF